MKSIIQKTNMNSITGKKFDNIVDKKCLKIMAFTQLLLMMAVALTFLVLSFEAGENQTLKMLGGGSRFDIETQYTFIGIAFFTVLVAALGIAAAYSHDEVINYIVSCFLILSFLVWICKPDYDAPVCCYLRIFHHHCRKCLFRFRKRVLVKNRNSPLN